MEWEQQERTFRELLKEIIPKRENHALRRICPEVFEGFV